MVRLQSVVMVDRTESTVDRVESMVDRFESLVTQNSIVTATGAQNVSAQVEITRTVFYGSAITN